MVTSGEREGEGDYEVQTTMYKISKLQGYIAQYKEYSQNFIITIIGVQPLKIVNHYVVRLKHIIL